MSIHQYQTLILDLDGTVYVDGIPIKDIVPKLNRFKNIPGNQIYYLTNNTSVGIDQYLRKINEMEISIDRDQIISPLMVSGDHLRKKYSKGFIVGSEEVREEYRNSFGIDHTDENPEFVLTTFDRTLTYQKLADACKFINQQLPYYITHIDLACPSTFGPIPDCGSISHILESTTKVKPIKSFGKPTEEMADFIKKKAGLSPESMALMAGDRLYTDIALGNVLGIDTLLVGTGEANRIDYERNDEYIVTYFCDSLPDFMEGI